jgi:hypothetical protein
MDKTAAMSHMQHMQNFRAHTHDGALPFLCKYFYVHQITGLISSTSRLRELETLCVQQTQATGEHDKEKAHRRNTRKMETEHQCADESCNGTHSKQCTGEKKVSMLPCVW